MRTVGIVRNLDLQGRIAIPIEIRRLREIRHNDLVEFLVDGTDIVLKKYQNVCLLCGRQNNFLAYSDSRVCGMCITDLISKRSPIDNRA